MLGNILKNKKAQQTAEYALLISLVVAAVVAMQTYAQRALQARIRSASNYMATQMSDHGFNDDGQLQYQPYYLQKEYNVETSDDTKVLYSAQAGFGENRATDTLRRAGGYSTETYNITDSTDW